MKKEFLAAIFIMLCSAVPVWSASYYIDSRTGSDDNPGTAPEKAWRTIARSKAAEIKPGDRILFARGGIWRETLLPHSGQKGNPVYYGAYGSGPLPKLYGSVDASDPDYWYESKPGIWTTKKIVPTPIRPFYQKHETGSGDSAQGKEDNGIQWKLYKESGVEAVFSKSSDGFKVECVKSKKIGRSIQIWGTIGQPNFSDGLLITFRARCSRPFVMPGFNMILAGPPYTGLYSDSGTYSLNQNWKDIAVYLTKKSLSDPIQADNFRYHLRLGTMPSDAILEIENLKFHAAEIDSAHFLRVDVGNIIFDHGEYKKLHRCGIKKWQLDDLKDPGQYWYDPMDKQVHLRWNGNPARDCHSIELALRETVVSQGGCHDIIYEDLAVAYGAAHGFGGGNTKNLTIRGCDIYYIGGGHQFTREDGKPVRFGNGIEFWGSCDENLVEKNRLWEIYDAALTNQGNGTSAQNGSYQKNLIYRENLIWNSEYSFEYWNRGTYAVSKNILFEKNICWNAGYGWAHGQRPDRNGCHCMFSTNSAPSEKIVVRQNIFHQATEFSICFRGAKLQPCWQEYLTLDENQYDQPEGTLIKWFNQESFQKDELPKIQKVLLFEKKGKFEKYDRPIPDVSKNY